MSITQILLDKGLLAPPQLEQAVALAEHIGLNFRVIRHNIMQQETFWKNPANRCYICKKSAITILKSIAAEEGISFIADGLNLDDCREWRPGTAACDEEGIWHPFVEVGMGKKDIRAAARDLGLPVWNKPSSACLASRIPYGRPLTRQTLLMVEAAEDLLKSLGFGQLRVRADGVGARIEMDKQEMEKALKMGEDIACNLKALGFSYVSLDLEGYRSGSMDEVLWTSRD
ncbi:MAG: ATP-dependent sacrificial sulfur transferase LarE [Methanothrix sp.]|nr:ATP-dependent sacrificial sulfur transferase LarE [Methanothrix sp.]